MTAEQLEELLSAMNGGGEDDGEAFTFLAMIAPSLARRVVAAERMVEALEGVRHYIDGYAGNDEQDALDDALTAYREASK